MSSTVSSISRPPLTVEELARPSPLILPKLFYFTRSDAYADHNGHLRSLRAQILDHIGPFGLLVCLALPRTAQSPADIPPATRAMLAPFLGAYVDFFVRSTRSF